MRRAGRAVLAVLVLALVAGIGTSRAQTPPPVVTPPAVPWNEAQLDWTPPETYAGAVGGSLADCATGPCGVLYIVEAAVSGGSGWGPVAITTEPHYRATDLRPGVWQFRVRAFFKGSGYSPAGPVVSKNVIEPGLTPPAATTIK